MVEKPHALRLVAIYLAVTFPPLVPGPWTIGHTTLAAIHLSALAACWRFGNRAESWSPWASWAALALIPLLYTEIAQINQLIGSGYNDLIITTWESAVFGSPATELAAAIPNVLLSEALHFAYLLYYPTIFVPPALLFFWHRTNDFEDAALAVVGAAVVCFVVFVYFPVQGPRYFGPPEGVPHGPLRGLTLAILESGSSRGAAFPSSHMALAAAQAVVQLRFHRTMGAILTVIALGIGVGAVYGGFHYGIDMVIGAIVGVAVAAWVLTGRSDPAEGQGDVRTTEGKRI